MINNILEEGNIIKSYFENFFINPLDGKKCILEMKEKKMNWKQMEWPGWYIEEIGRTQLIQEFGGSIGPTFGKTTFDYALDYVWDIKSHTNNSKNKWCILNDVNAIKKNILDFGGIGFLIAIIDVEYDINEQFKIWHDTLKGKISDYEIKRINRGATSRKRKTSCVINEWKCIFFDDFQVFIDGESDGWVSKFQGGMRNSNGNLRNEKIKINLHSLPSDILIL